MRAFPINLFPITDIVLNPFLQYAFLFKVIPIEVDMKHRIFQPVLFQLLHGQSLEQFFMSQEIMFKRGYKQTLAEPSRTAQKVDLSRCH